MAWEFSVLVVANVTASSDELLAALRQRAEQGGCRFTLVMPASGADARRLDAALEGCGRRSSRTYPARSAILTRSSP